MSRDKDKDNVVDLHPKDDDKVLIDKEKLEFMETMASVMEYEHWVMYGMDIDGGETFVCSSGNIIEQLGVIESAKQALITVQTEETQH